MELNKRRLGRTGLMVTELGLGAMDTPQSAEGADTLQTALDLGINFIDTAREYQGSEYLIGQVIRDRGAKDFFVGTKTFQQTSDGCQHDVDRSLRMLGVDSVDLYQLHDVSSQAAWDQVMGEGGALEGLQIAKIRGLVKFIGVSSHSLDVLELAIDCGEFDTVMLEYSAFFPQTRRLIAHGTGARRGRHRHAAPGRLRADEHNQVPYRRRLPGALTPDNLLRYVLSHPGVSVAIPGARYPSRIRDNVAAVGQGRPLSESEQRQCEEEAGGLY